jgi:hypothetical protein
MNDIQRPEIGQALVRFLGIREANPAPTLNPEVQPVILVGDLTLPIEPNVVRQASGFSFSAAAAGQISSVQLWNPTTSGVLLKVTGIYISAATTNEYGLSISSAALANDYGAAVKNFTNGVLGANSNPVAQLRWDQTLGFGGNTGWRGQIAVQSSPFPVPIGHVLLPGQGINVASLVANTYTLGSFVWTEVPQEPVR